MATYFGNDGSVTLGPTGVKFQITQWQATVEVDVAVAPRAFGEIWEEAKLTGGRVTGSLTGKLSSELVLDLPPISGDWDGWEGTITLTMASGKTISGPGLISSVSPSLSRDGAGEISANFRSTGAWTGVSAGS
jgi:hypothetical protein